MDTLLARLKSYLATIAFGRVVGQVGDLSEKLKSILPDEIAILTKTNGWKTEDQQALVGAWRAGEPTAVYEAWVKGNPQDTAGAE